jgi:hypothetical protein
MAMLFTNLRNTNPKGKPPTRHNGNALPGIIPNLASPGKLHLTMDEALENLNLTGEAGGHLRHYEISIHAKSFDPYYNEGALKYMAHMIINGRGGENGVDNNNLSGLAPIDQFNLTEYTRTSPTPTSDLAASGLADPSAGSSYLPKNAAWSG